jgi:hypothetical protein
MQRLRWLVLMGFWVSLMNAGKLQLPEPYDDPGSALEEAWEQLRRMRSMGNRCDIAEKIRIKQVAQYLNDICDCLNRLEANIQLGTASLRQQELAGLWRVASQYKYYPINLQTVSVNFEATEEEDDGLHRPAPPGDDDSPFSDGDNSEGDDEDELTVHAAQDQETDDLFNWE